jgi:putative tryptophan/tyrosine transport system substrate-binding protein
MQELAARKFYDEPLICSDGIGWSVRLDVGRADHLAPLLGFVGDERQLSADPYERFASWRNWPTNMQCFSYPLTDPCRFDILLSGHSQCDLMQFDQLNRREFVTLFVGGAVLTSAARAQQPDRMQRIGVLVNLAQGDPKAESRIEAFRMSLEELGWTPGRNIHLAYRSAVGDPDHIQTLAAELVGLAPDVILGAGSLVTLALQKATRSIPIVFVLVADPIDAGFVTSLARPNGNITGFSNFRSSMGGKMLEVLKACLPSLDRVLVIVDRTSPSWIPYFRAIEAASFGVAGGGQNQAFRGLRLTPGGVSDTAELERAINTFAQEPNGALIVAPNNITVPHHELIIALAARHRLPAIYSNRFFVASGGLMSYGVDVLDLYRGAASYVDRILKGAKPIELPVQLPTKFEFAINLKTAKALGVEVPTALLAEADEVIR